MEKGQLTVESVHRTGHVHDQSQSLGLLLRGSGLWIVIPALLVDGLFPGDSLNQSGVVQLTCRSEEARFRRKYLFEFAEFFSFFKSKKRTRKFCASHCNFTK